jgi:hypothetical protein
LPADASQTTDENRREREEVTMRVDIYDRDYVGSAEWQGPGDVRVEVADEGRRSWFERYFQTEDSFLMGSLGAEEFASERRDSSEQAFLRATYNLAAYSYRVRSDGDGP